MNTDELKVLEKLYKGGDYDPDWRSYGFLSFFLLFSAKYGMGEGNNVSRILVFAAGVEMIYFREGYN